MSGKHAGWALGALVVGFVSSPALLTHRGFGPDFTNHLWLVWQQGEAIANVHHPTIFLHTSSNVTFEPFYGFYGGTLYAAVGSLSAILGSAEIALLFSIVAAFACAYLGFVWLARLCGLEGWHAHAHAIVAVTSPYLLMDLYARGAWPEFVALCAMPLVLAGALALLRPGPHRARDVAAFAAGVVLFTGSHNITLLWRAIVLTPLVIGLLVIHRVRPHPRDLARVAAVGALAVGVNSWFLLLDVLHNNDVIASISPFGGELTHAFNALGPILDPLRGDAPTSGTRGLTVAAPVFAIAWALVALAERRRLAGRPQQSLSLVLALATLLVALIISDRFWDVAGRPFTLVQFPYRLNGYIALLAAGMVLCGLALRPRRAVSVALAAVLALSVAQGTAQGWRAGRPGTPNSLPDRRAALAQRPVDVPGTWYDEGIYGDRSGPQIDPPPDRQVRLPTPEPGAEAQRATVTVPAGRAPVALQVAAGPYVVAFDGVDVVGRTATGRAVVRSRSPRAGAVDLRVREHSGGVLRAGELLSTASLLALLALIGATARRRRSAA